MTKLNRDYLLEKYTNLEDSKEIKLGSNTISRIEANAFQGLNQLELIELHENVIDQIEPGAFEHLSKLRTLRLESNRLEKVESSMFKGLVRLEWLSLRNNRIVECDENGFSDLNNLKYFYLMNNNIEEIKPCLLKSLTKLVEVSITTNNISELYSRTFESQKNLKELFIWNNKIQKIDADAFKGLKRLRTLWLQDNQIAGLESNVFWDCVHLKSLWLNNNKIKYINEHVFERLVNLERLSLRDNEIADIDKKAFVNLTKLKLLALNNNRLKKIHPECFKSLESIGLIQLYDNDPDTNLISYYDENSNQSASDEKKIREKGFLTDWNIFLQQFNEIDGMERRKQIQSMRVIIEGNNDKSVTSSIRKDPFVGKVLSNRYEAKNKIGKGSFADVYLVHDINQKTYKAMKIMDKLGLSSENTEHDFLWKINQENIIRYFDHFDLKISSWNHICIITEYCDNGDLKHKIDKAKQSKESFNEKQILKWMIESTNALKYLHSKKIIHRDIKPGNMLLTKENVIKLADLGIAKLIESTPGKSHAGTANYMSPEIFMSLFKSVFYSANSDIWSLGCVLYELVFLDMAFPLGQRSNPKVPDVSGAGLFCDVLCKMLERDQEIRIKSDMLYDEFIYIENKK